MTVKMKWLVFTTVTYLTFGVMVVKSLNTEAIELAQCATPIYPRL